MQQDLCVVCLQLNFKTSFDQSIIDKDVTWLSSTNHCRRCRSVLLTISNWELKINKKMQIRFVDLPDKTWSSIFDSLFLVKMSLTIRVILEKAPFWISVIKLFVKFTDRSLVWVEKTRGVSRSEKKREEKKLLENRAVDHEPIFRMDCLKKLLLFFTYSYKITFTEEKRGQIQRKTTDWTNCWLDSLIFLPIKFSWTKFLCDWLSKETSQQKINGESRLSFDSSVYFTLPTTSFKTCYCCTSGHQNNKHFSKSINFRQRRGVSDKPRFRRQQLVRIFPS